MQPRKYSLLVCALLLCGAAFPASAQMGSGRIAGRIVDPAGAALPNVQITATDIDTSLSLRTLTTGTGDYDFVQLRPGEYRLETVAAGFKNLRRTGVTVETGQVVRLDLALEVGGASEQVTVSANAAQLQSEAGDVHTAIHGSAIPAMPLNGRIFVQLATFAPGVALPQGTQLPRINGGRPRTNEYLFDGISALQPEPGQVAFFPIVDDIQEFSIETNGVPAEMGRFNGGVVNLSTRAGTNQLHGSLYEFLRHEDLNARNYFASTTARKPEFRRNQYGATLGGPLARDRVFFFTDYQGQRQNLGVVRTSTVPTVNERAGIFTGVSKIYDPSTTTFAGGAYVRKEFPSDTINTALDPVAVQLLNRYPVPTSGGQANNYTRVANDLDHQNQFDVRVDGKFRGNDFGFVRYSYFNDVDQPATPLPDGSGALTGTVLGTNNVAGLSRVLGQQIVVGETHLFGLYTLNDLHFGYTRRSNDLVGTRLESTPSAALGVPGIPVNAAFNNALPLFTLAGIQQLGSSSGTFSNYQTAVMQLVDSISHVAGRHTLKAGIDFRWAQLNAVAPGSPTGAFAFTTTGTNQQGVTNSGNAIASFLLGQVDNFQIDLQQNKMRPRARTEEYFVQDDWHLLPELTINAGLRWTLNFPSTEKNNQGAVFNLASQQLQYLGQGGYSRSARELHWDNVGPRFGMAWLATPKTVVRGGFGIVFFDQSGITTPFTTPQFPFIQNVAQRTQDSVNAAFILADGPAVAPIPLTADAGLGQSVYTVNRQLGSGYAQQWNLAIEREITPNLSFQVGYVGSHVVHVGMPDTNLNQLTTTQLSQGSALLAKVPNPYYGQLPASSSIGGKTISYAQSIKPYPRFLNVAAYRNNTGQSNYNGVEIKIEQRPSHGLSFIVSYTHSKLIDDASSVFSTTVLSSPNSSSLIAADTYNPLLERDSSSGDMPNVLVASGTYQLPAGSGYSFVSNRLAAKVLGGWSLNGILTLQSGMPVTVTQATNNNSFAGFVLQRPNVIGRTSLAPSQRTPGHFFNTAAFTTAPQFTLGNASRNPVRGPAYRDGDIALIKHTAVTERVGVEFRTEVFNVTNTPAFAQPNGSFGSPAFGSIANTATDPRVVQFGARVAF
jgi:Carboxypeptidase regulatory-like domain